MIMLIFSAFLIKTKTCSEVVTAAPGVDMASDLSKRHGANLVPEKLEDLQIQPLSPAMSSPVILRPTSLSAKRPSSVM